ncbi:uncharacterized protein LOC111869360 isoform X4 [Cryptotermes secundus]|uniref:uncharacterized protein LOC111869360 isoform X4 n=1 Tax=Cryptotermes secundus TaxID=105785 RepID=UPI000CD7BA60|nr:uncharacterized protein LOC111869360 isoform X4 [Cryptotermes secundus]
MLAAKISYDTSKIIMPQFIKPHTLEDLALSAIEDHVSQLCVQLMQNKVPESKKILKIAVTVFIINQQAQEENQRASD